MSSKETAEEVLQKENWERIASHVKFVVEENEDEPILDSLRALFAVNLVYGDRLLVDALVNKALENGSSIPKIAALAGLVSSYIQSVGRLLVEDTVSEFLVAFQKNDARRCYAKAKLLSQLLNYGIAHEIVVLQVLHVVTEHLNAHSVRLTMEILRQCGHELLTVARGAHDLVYEGLRTYFQDSKSSYELRREFEALFELRKREYSGRLSKLPLPPYEPLRYVYMIDPEANDSSSGTNLRTFVFDPNFDEKEEEFESIRSKIELLDEAIENPPAVVEIEDKTQSDSLEFKKKIYLTLKGSLSGDEAAHKLLKMRVPDRNKKILVDTLVMACSQETTYSKFYGVTAERLCSSHGSWKHAFAQSFKESYDIMDTFQATQVRNMGKFWGHILASDYVGLDVLEAIHMNATETTPAGRVFLKFMLQELVLDLGIGELKSRLEEPWVQPFLKGLFPVDDVEKTRFSINFFTAIGLGPLTEAMRQTLESEKLTIEEQKPRSYVEADAEVEDSDDGNEDQTARTWEKFNRMRQARNSKSGGVHEDRNSRQRSRTPPRRRRSRTPTRRRSRSPYSKR
ncbi:LAFA_0E00364g1_1 [Lachancea sp. 'fantastica']|nr:LAFA_0E00364g1_1 [Lachancea sp. 'fantastica']